MTVTVNLDAISTVVKESVGRWNAGREDREAHMNWHNLHPVAKILIATILGMLICGGAGYILYIVNAALDRMEAREKQEASMPITAVRHIDIKR